MSQATGRNLAGGNSSQHSHSTSHMEDAGYQTIDPTQHAEKHHMRRYLKNSEKLNDTQLDHLVQTINERSQSEVTLPEATSFLLKNQEQRGKKCFLNYERY